MKPLGDHKKHYWLSKRMAKTTGADLVAAYQAGELGQEEWAQMVHKCRGCDWAEGCARWLRKTPTATDVPSTCVNCGRFTDLQADTDKRV